MGRPDLRPEKGTNRDLGLIWSRPEEGRRMEAVLFWNDVFDLITYEPVSVATTRPTNLGRAEIRGLALDLDSGRFGPFGFNARFTRLSAIDRTDDRVAGGKQLSSRPGHEIGVYGSVHAGPSRWSFALTAIGENYLESGERQRVPGRVLVGVGMAWRLGPVRLDTRIRNLTDEEVFDLWDHPLPGRTLSVSLSRTATP
jgi:outer membrane receptor protein involved in Fe transport